MLITVSVCDEARKTSVSVPAVLEHVRLVGQRAVSVTYVNRYTCGVGREVGLRLDSKFMYFVSDEGSEFGVMSTQEQNRTRQS